MSHLCRKNGKYFYGLLVFAFAFMVTACSFQPNESNGLDKDVADVPTLTVVATSTPTKTPVPTAVPAPTSTPEFDYTHYEIVPDLASIAHDIPKLATSTSSRPIWTQVFCYTFQVPCIWSYNVLQPEYSFEHRWEFSSFVGKRIVAIGTHDAYVALIEGKADIILVARAPSEDEIEAAQSQNVELDVQSVALDAFVFIVNVQNPVDDLSIEQIQDIYSGKITNWKDVGGLDNEIHAFQRNDNSGSQELMESLVMKCIPMIDAPEMIMVSMAGIFTAIGQNPVTPEGDISGFGYSVYFYAQNMIPNDDIEFIGINGIEPTSATIANRSYPLTSEVYVVVRKSESSDSSAVKLRDWLLTDMGQYTIESSGYVPIRLP